MTKATETREQLLAEIQRLRERLTVAEDTIQAIQSGQTDAVIVTGPCGDQVFTLTGADHTYRLLIESMNEGAAMVSENGTVLYCNRKFSDMLGLSHEAVTGASAKELVSRSSSREFDVLFGKVLAGESKAAKLELLLSHGDEVPIQASMSRMTVGSAPVVAWIATDLRELKSKEAKLRELSATLLRAQDEERRHVARELHDSAGQLLTALSMSLERLAQEAKKHTPDLAPQVERNQAMVQQLHRDIRTTSYLLHPPLLDESGLPSAMQWYVQGIEKRSDLKVSLNFSQNFGRLSKDLELVIFRLLQEALTNIHCHSGSKTAAIRFNRDVEQIRVEIQDYGKGIAPDRLVEIRSKGSGVGIEGMRERLYQHGGELKIHSDGLGTVVVATIPISKTETVNSSGFEPIKTA